jgi:hypothetical protein
MRALFFTDFISCERSLEFVACSPILKNCGEREQDASCPTVRAEEYKRKQGLDWSWVGTPKLADASTTLRACNAAGRRFHDSVQLTRGAAGRACIDRSRFYALRSGRLATQMDSRPSSNTIAPTNTLIQMRSHTVQFTYFT